jgi:hypothetical protein
MTIKPAPSLPFETFLAVQLQDRGLLIRPYFVATEKEEKQLQILRLRYASLRMTVITKWLAASQVPMF